MLLINILFVIFMLSVITNGVLIITKVMMDKTSTHYSNVEMAQTIIVNVAMTFTVLVFVLIFLDVIKVCDQCMPSSYAY